MKKTIVKMLQWLRSFINKKNTSKILTYLILGVKQSRIILNIDLYFYRKKYKTITFSCSELIQTTQSNYLGDIPVGIRDRMNQEFYILEPFVSTINQAQIIGKNAVTFDINKNIISTATLPGKENLSHRFEGNLNLDAFLKVTGISFSSQSAKLNTACNLVNVWSKTYYHWIIDCLTRIEGVEYYFHHTGCKPKLIIDSNPTSWQIESLKLFGYGEDDYISWNYSIAFVEKLIVPSFRRQGEYISKNSLCWLRNKIFKAIDLKETIPSEYIYISRSKASGRRVTNEEEVIDFLKPIGFASYTLEEMSFTDQVCLFSKAKMIIAPHGAGLTNMIFSPIGTNIIEFVTPWVSSGYFVPAQILGFKHGFINCEQSEIQKLRRTKGDIFVDIKKLKILLDKFENI